VAACADAHLAALRARAERDADAELGSADWFNP
jgi:hypothetical protein